VRNLVVGHQSYFFHNDYLVETPRLSMLTLGWIINNLVDAERWIIRGAHWECVVVWELTEGQKLTIDSPISLWNCRDKEFENPVFSVEIDGRRRRAAHRGRDGQKVETEIGGDYKTRYLIATSRFSRYLGVASSDPFLLFQTHQERAFGPGVRHAYRFAVAPNDYDRRADGTIMLRKDGPLISRNFFLFQESMWNIKDFWANYQFDKDGILRQALKPRGEFFPLKVTDNKSARKKNGAGASGKIYADDAIYIQLAHYATYLNNLTRFIRSWHHNLSFETPPPFIFMRTIYWIGGFIQFLRDVDPYAFIDIDIPDGNNSYTFPYSAGEFTIGNDPGEVREVMRRLIDTYRYLIDNAPRPYYDNYRTGAGRFFDPYWYVNSEIIHISLATWAEIRDWASGENQNVWFAQKFHSWLDRAFYALDEMARAMETMTVKSTPSGKQIGRGSWHVDGALRESRKLQKRELIDGRFQRRFQSGEEDFDPYDIATGNNDVSLRDIIRVIPPDATRPIFFWGLIGYERRAITLYEPPPEPEAEPFSPIIAVTPRPPAFPWDNTIHPNEATEEQLYNGFHQINPDVETRDEQLAEIRQLLCGNLSDADYEALYQQMTFQQKATVSFIETFYPDPCGNGDGGGFGGGGGDASW
jgi:hypothetical protein